MNYLKKFNELFGLKKYNDEEFANIILQNINNNTKLSSTEKNYYSDPSTFKFEIDNNVISVIRSEEGNPDYGLITKFKLFESWDSEAADEISTKDLYVGVNQGRPFAYNKLTNEIHVGNVGTTHESEENESEENNMIHPTNEGDEGIWYWHGRIWENEKLLAFWYYPDPELFQDIIDQLSVFLHKKMWDNDWRIKVYKNENSEIVIGDWYENSDKFTDSVEELIPIEEYIGSEDAPDEELLAHLKKSK